MIDSWTPDNSSSPRARTSSLTVRHDTPTTQRSVNLADDGRPKIPQVYDSEIDRLAGRTIRAYRLVVNYQRDCPTGYRWTSEHIDTIREAGSHLETDREALESIRLGLVHGEERALVEQIRGAAHALRDHCEVIQDLIREHEQLPVFGGEHIEWAVSADTKSLQFRDPYEEEDIIQRLAGRVRRGTPVEHRYPQAQRHNVKATHRETTRYFASDTWRPN